MKDVKEIESPSLPRRQTDPAWLQDYFLNTGHDERTHNATFTFIKRNGHIYAVTCGHVLDGLANRQIMQGAINPTLALHLESAVLNLSSFIATEKPIQIVKAPTLVEASRDVDIAIARMPPNYWELLQEKKSKKPIDLDNWKEPLWNNVRYCLAAGYPDEHKAHVKDGGLGKVSVPFTCVTIEVASNLSKSSRCFSLASRLNDPHGYFFSGMSGGPVYAIEGMEERTIENDELLPIGIIFEGAPASGKGGTRLEEKDAAIFGPNDLFFRALMLTPESFDGWLEQVGLIP